MTKMTVKSSDVSLPALDSDYDLGGFMASNDNPPVVGKKGPPLDTKSQNSKLGLGLGAKKKGGVMHDDDEEEDDDDKMGAYSSGAKSSKKPLAPQDESFDGKSIKSGSKLALPGGKPGKFGGGISDD